MEEIIKDRSDFPSISDDDIETAIEKGLMERTDDGRLRVTGLYRSVLAIKSAKMMLESLGLPAGVDDIRRVVDIGCPCPECVAIREGRPPEGVTIN